MRPYMDLVANIMKNQNKKTLTVLSQKNPAKKLGDILDKLMTQHEIDGIKLSAHSGVPVTTINRLRTGHPSNNPTISSLVPLAAHFNISVSQLLGDEPIVHHARIMNNQIPIITWEESIRWPKLSRDIQATIQTNHQYSKHAYALLAEQDWEHMLQGMALIVDPAITPTHRDYVIVYHKSQSTPSIKQLIQDDAQTYLKPIFPGLNTIPLTSQHKMLGAVMEYKKYLKKLD